MWGKGAPAPRPGLCARALRFIRGPVLTSRRPPTPDAAGEFNNENKEKNTKAFFTDDCSMSFSSGTVFKNSDMFTTYSGHAGMLEFTRRLLEIEFADFAPQIVSSTKDSVLIAATYTPTNKASGRTAAKALTDYMEWTVSKGRVSKVVITIPDAATMDALFLSPDEAKAVVGGCMGAWGAGKWSDPSSKVAKESFAALCTPDIVIDATAPMANTDMYKVRVRRARRDRPRPEMCEAAGGGQPPKRDAA